MKVIIKEPGHMPRQLVIDKSLKTLQELVGGYIEHVGVNGDIGFIINEEGKFRDMEPNFIFRDDVIVGPAVFVGYDGEDFGDVPASVADIRAIIAKEGAHLFVRGKHEEEIDI